MEAAHQVLESAALSSMYHQLLLFLPESKIYILHLHYRVTACGSSISQNLSYIQNPGYPTAYTTSGDCKYTVSPVNSSK